jgi:type IV pilus assembly protein PilB
VTQAEVTSGAAPRAYATGVTPRIGELLIERELISEDQLQLALDLQRRSGHRMGETLVAMGVLSERDLARVLAERLGREFIDFASTPVDLVVANRVPEDLARRYEAIPVMMRGDGLVVAMANPDDVFALDDLQLVTGSSIIPTTADRSQIHEALDRVWSGTTVASEVDSAADALAEEDDLDIKEAATDAPIIRLVNALLEQAIDERASDIHLEPGPRVMRIRLRIDGILRDISEAPRSISRALVSRIKVLASIDIANSRVPHDGRFSITLRGRSIDVRVVTLPSTQGEAVVMRLLDRSATVLDFEQLGIDAHDIELLRDETRKPQGAILVTGPTGSGKTTTLYAATAQLNATERSILTVEDPVEYHLAGTKQIQIDPRAGRTFPAVLRASLRADPDIMLIGEIRDEETARIASEAAITGHLVLSTLHTTSAAAAPMRLVDMGVERYLVASALSCIVAQRLVRRLCRQCGEPDPAAASWLRSLGATDLDGSRIRRAVGCPNCRQTGYHGRVAVIEVLTVSEDIRRLIIGRAGVDEIHSWAIAAGMVPLQRVAMQRVLDGVTSIDEMLRVLA